MENIKLLMLEDNMDDAALMQATLKRSGLMLDIKLVSTREDFINAVDNFVPDIIVSDHRLPGFSSDEALAYAREKMHFVPFILVTGTVSDEFAAGIIKAGADDYILKDRLSRLPLAITTAIKQRRTEKEKQDTAQELQENERKYRTMMERVSDAFVSLDKDWCYTYVNSQAGAILGREPGQLIGKNIWTEFPEGVDKAFFKAYHHAMKAQRYIPFDLWLENHIYPSPDGLSIFFRNITEKKRAELQVKQSEEKYRTLFIKSPLPKWIYDHVTLRFLDVNDTAINLYGYSREEFLAMTIKDIRPPEDLPLLLEDVKKVVPGAETRRGKWRHRKKNGELMIVETLAHSFDFGGSQTRMVIATDVTEKLKAEQELYQSRMRLNQAQEIAHLGNWVIDFASNTSKWSDEAYRIYGVTPGDHNFTFEDWMSFVHPDDIENVEKEVNMQRRSLGDVGFYHRIIRTDGNTRHIYSESKYEFDKAGQPTGLYGIVLDVTESKKAEQALRDSEMRLKEAQAIAHISSWDIDMLSGVHTWSDEFYRIYGLNKNEVTPSAELFLGLVHPDDTSNAQQKMAEAFETLKGSSFEFRFIRKDGIMRHGYSEWQFEFDKGGKPLRLFGILQDITERKVAEENIRTMEEKMLQQTIQEQKEVARAIITGQERERNHIGKELHDNINQVLAGTKIFLGIAAKKNDVVKEAIRYPMELIDKSIEEIRLLCHKLVTPVKDIKLEEQVRDLLVKLDKAGAINTLFIYNVPPGLLSDDIKLNIYRILQEQVNNIIKYAGAKNVTVSVTSGTDSIEVLVTDDGKGFDLNAKREGIGISNMKNRVETFNGALKITTRPGKGCVLQAIIPFDA
jgi:PAS domain S-box-containing protein